MALVVGVVVVPDMLLVVAVVSVEVEDGVVEVKIVFSFGTIDTAVIGSLIGEAVLLVVVIVVESLLLLVLVLVL